MSEETADHRIEDHTGGPARLPRFGVVAAGAVSLLLAASLVLIAPIGLFVAPLGLAPVAQWVGAGRRSIQVWGWVVAALLVLSLTGVSLLGAPAWTYLVAYCVVVALPAAAGIVVYEEEDGPKKVEVGGRIQIQYVNTDAVGEVPQ